MAKRIDEIRQKVETEGEVFVSDLSRIYNVTEETIRRDLEKLKNDGIITRTFGGAVLNTTPQNDRVHFFRQSARKSPCSQRNTSSTWRTGKYARSSGRIGL